MITGDGGQPNLILYRIGNVLGDTCYRLATLDVDHYWGGVI